MSLLVRLGDFATAFAPLGRADRGRLAGLLYRHRNEVVEQAGLEERDLAALEAGVPGRTYVGCTRQQSIVQCREAIMDCYQEARVLCSLLDVLGLEREEVSA